MKLSVIMPVFNEAPTIAEIIERVRKAPIEGVLEPIVVDDGFTDGTREFLGRFDPKRDDVRIVVQERNQGKGATIRRGIEHLTGEITRHRARAGDQVGRAGCEDLRGADLLPRPHVRRGQEDRLARLRGRALANAGLPVRRLRRKVAKSAPTTSARDIAYRGRTARRRQYDLDLVCPDRARVGHHLERNTGQLEGSARYR